MKLVGRDRWVWMACGLERAEVEPMRQKVGGCVLYTKLYTLAEWSFRTDSESSSSH